VIGAATTLLFVLDFALLREGFCRSVCPYGLLQGILEDGRSLHVRFDESSGPCLQCRLCEKVCPMEIDIRKGAFQIECTRCGSCVDACVQFLAKKKRLGLLAFDFSSSSLREWDAKRVLVALSTVGFAFAFVVAVALRQEISFRLSPVYTTSGVPRDLAETSFLLRAANKGKEPVTVAVRPEGLPASATVVGLSDGTVPAGTERRFDLTVRLPRGDVRSSVVPFTLVVSAKDRSESFPAALYVAGRKDS
jgi:NAD-dependent dihydropyrimidine dehydrogenase PreA subunit